MPFHRRIVVAVILAVCGSPARAASPEATTFSHEDWELACDNTRTCRIAGYPGDQDMGTVSVLLTRKAGPATATTGRVMLGCGWDEDDLKLPARFKLALWIDGRAKGGVAMTNDDRTADLSAAQVAALLDALARYSRIEFRTQDQTWRLSDRGASAVLLKMDEAQGRIGTVGALRRKGKGDESKALPPLPAPVVRAVAPLPPLPTDERFGEKHEDAIRAALRKATSADDCMDLHESESQESLQIVRLTKTKLLVSTRCWLAAYNMGSGYWVIDEKPPFRPQLVTTDGTDYDAGTIGASHKGRGLGDCWGKEEWTWDGTRFVHTSSSSTGQCKGFAGGAWDLPTLVTEIRRDK